MADKKKVWLTAGAGHGKGPDIATAAIVTGHTIDPVIVARTAAVASHTDNHRDHGSAETTMSGPLAESSTRPGAPRRPHPGLWRRAGRHLRGANRSRDLMT